MSLVQHDDSGGGDVDDAGDFDGMKPRINIPEKTGSCCCVLSVVRFTKIDSIASNYFNNFT